MLQKANQNLELNKFFIRMQKYDLIILDELGYVPFAKQTTNLLFQFFAECYERRSLLITTNLAFSQWDQIFKEKQTTVAAVDRLTHHGYILEFKGDSFRLKSSFKKNKNI
jgi:DNA replication protein DnaC